MNKYLLLVTLVVAIGTRLRPTQAVFADRATVSANTFVTATSFSTSSSSFTLANHLVINEVAYQGGTGLEWVEVYNPTSAPVDLNGWKIVDNSPSSGEESLPNISLGSNQYFVMGELTDVAFRAAHPSIPTNTIYVQASGAFVGSSGLRDDGDMVALKNNLGVIVDGINWGDYTTYFNPAISTVLTGHSIGRDPNGLDTDTAADFVDKSTPTPGS